MEDNNNLNIVLVGMMGAGKSYIGAKLAKLLSHFTYVDTDDEIEKICSMVIQLLERDVDVYLNVNNYYEGSAPLTIQKIRNLLKRN